MGPEEVEAMPVYEFVCRKCRKKFEVVGTVAEYDPKKVKCPKCKSRSVERRWSRVFAVTSKKS
jgi:putative FmdB family regulatory protein